MKKTLTGLTLAAAFGFTALAASPTAAATMPFENCTEAAAAGVYNIPSTDPRFQPGLDSDGDGTGCEDPNRPTSTATPMPSSSTSTPTTPAPGGVVNTPKGGANTGVAQENGTDATGVLLAAGGVVAIAGIAVGVRRKSGNHA